MPQTEQPAQHTGGPFEVFSEGRLVVVGGGPNNDDLAEFYYADEAAVETTRAAALANAQMFKAAPMMLAALKEVARLSVILESGALNTDHHEMVLAALVEARAAIKAAKGE